MAGCAILAVTSVDELVPASIQRNSPYPSFLRKSPVNGEVREVADAMKEVGSFDPGTEPLTPLFFRIIDYDDGHPHRNLK
jgi:hypothetical protein